MAMASTAAKIGVTLSFGEIFACFAFGRLLSFMWILINALQLIVFMGIWQILYPDFLKVVLAELRRVSWGEYFDDLEIARRTSELLWDSPDEQ